MLKTKRYVYVAFMCHLAVEKLPKGCVAEFTDTMPPKIHSWNALASRAGLTIPPEHQAFMDEMTDASIPTRYPNTLRGFTEGKAKRILRQSKALFTWLRPQLK
jgi:HEPN domain-containing protein